MMRKRIQPSKEQIRTWLHDRWQRQQPLPEMGQIKCRLGWAVCTELPAIPERTVTEYRI